MIFGLKVKNYSDWEKLLCDISQKLGQNKKFQIVTLNPEMVVQAQKDKDFKTILKKVFLIIDGIGIIFANLIINKKWFKRFPGVDLMEKMIQSHLFQDYFFYFFGASQESLNIFIKKIRQKYPNIKIAGFHPGEITEIHRLQNIKNQADIDYTTPEIIQKINNSKADILFVALGSPLQEKWIYYNFKKLNKVKLAIGVGGAFDMISGVSPRAPLFLRKIGLEWLWRLLIEPKRIKRIFKATIVFSFIVFKNLWDKAIKIKILTLNF